MKARTFKVFKNDKNTGQIVSGRFSDKFLKEYAYDLVAPSTHMAEFRRTEYGYEYSTTIGVYIQFKEVPCE